MPSAGLTITIIGGGLAGCEAAWQLLATGHRVTLVEMKPARFSPAHTSPRLAELVCSNSLRSDRIQNAVGLLKTEMRALNSLILAAADASAVPAGRALAVDREAFSRQVEDALLSKPGFGLVRGEVREIPPDGPVLIATGPLTSDAFAAKLAERTGAAHLAFYDAIAPIVTGDSIDKTRVFRASRYDPEGGGDYLNCPLNREEYERFLNAVLTGEKVPLHAFEEVKCFEGCLPIEVLAERGPRTLTFGPLKPVGLTDPRTGQQPYAVVQLRQENLAATLFNMVGFQTKLTWPEQRRIFRMIPGLEQAEFARYGSVHRNTFLNAPAVLRETLQLKTDDRIFFAGQITGVEGYVESAAMGLIAGLSLSRHVDGKTFLPPPPTTALGSLIRFLTVSDPATFQPMNVNFGLLTPLAGRVRKQDRGDRYAARALTDLAAWLGSPGL
ncbi:MAG TPA: methylenetetrahydrofolate--tRNA-(uracil(54)-C(5))-methyltransferase (FADH(2)-oxidizing) TrmFO [Syntrophales bacterium]|nr:methylenetetrahydrofolate--tRNA-(uracil(54)-C(5))-methyltransferase (FADH(2)-oxidizing) TrmFO [Syntrophales bacterium]